MVSLRVGFAKRFTPVIRRPAITLSNLILYGARKTAIEIEEKIAARHFNKESGTGVRISSGAPFGYREGLAGVRLQAAFSQPRRVAVAPNKNIENNPMQSSRRSPARTLWANT